MFSVFHNDAGLQCVVYKQALSCKENEGNKGKIFCGEGYNLL